MFEAAQEGLAEIDEPGFAPADFWGLVRTRHVENLDESTGLGGHDKDAITEVNGFFDTVGDEKDRSFLLLPKLNEQLLHAQANARIERAKRFVHEENARLEDERGGDGNALLHAAGQFGGIFLLRPFETDFADPFLGLLQSLGGFHAAQLQTEGDIVQDVEMGEERIFLIHEAAIWPWFTGRFAEEADRAGGGRKVRIESGDDAENGGFAATGWADDGDQFANVGQIFDEEADVLDGDLVPETFGDLVEGNQFGQGAWGGRWKGGGWKRGGHAHLRWA